MHPIHFIVFLPLLAAIVGGLANKAAPAVFTQVLTTGAVNPASGSLPGTISSFSSRGPSQIDPGEYFPAVMAPGEDI